MRSARTDGQSVPGTLRPGQSPLIFTGLLVLHLALLGSRGSGDDSSAVDFDEQVAPLLARRCLNCHNPSDRKGGLDLTTREALAAGGDSGAALDLTHPGDSPLWERIAADEMPPKQPLSGDEKRIFELWIQGGASWGRGPIDRFRYTTESRAGYDWWSLKPVARPPEPEVPGNATARNAIDRFVSAVRFEHRLPHAPEADRRTLVRRLWFDLLGLPPTPEEVEAFVNDTDPAAWEDLIDRLLSRPEYGERWGRHWLDVVRFGESQGFERDKLRPNSWQYRDWVVSAFNRDLPYDEFVRRQIAGDVLFPDDPEAVIATGFIVAAPWDEVGQSQQSLAMKMVVRQDELEDVIGTTGQTFLGLTLHCARCHDHKFDPVSQREYYRLSAAFAGVRHGERDCLTAQGRQIVAPRDATLRQELARRRAVLEQFDRPHRAAIRDSRKQQNVDVPVPLPISRWDFDTDLKDSVGELHGTAFGSARVDQGRLILDGSAECRVETAMLTGELREKTLAVWVALDNLHQQGGAPLGVQSPSGAVFDAIVFGEREAGQWMAGSNGFARSQSFQGPVETEKTPATVQITLVSGADQSVSLYRNGSLYGTPYRAGSLATFEKGKAQILFGMRHSPPGGNRMFAGAIDRAALFDRALSPREVAALAGVVSEHVSNDEILARLSPAERAERNRLVQSVSEIQAELALISGGKVYAVSPAPPEPTHYLERGNPQLKRELMTPGTLQAISALSADFELPTDAPDAERRRRLAEWITNPHNPLTPRVIINRLWHYHFGTGLVDTPNDFGFNGGRPTHPALLDWLAAELMDPQAPARTGTESAQPPAPWSLKHIHRLILNSATYRQSSVVVPEAMRIDAGNRYLWRRNPQRLEAEAVRDAILAVSGELNSTLGGPGFQDFRTFTFNSQFYEMLDPVGYDYNRRTLYRTWVRSGRSDFLDVFDCPDPSTIAPRRAVTTTPLQALAMLNNSFTLRMAERFATRVRTEAGDSLERQVQRVFALALGRQAIDTELAPAVQFAQAHGLNALCRVIFNSNEFLYID